MMRYLLILFLLNACTSEGILRGSGEIAPTPYGFTDYCLRHPDRAECGGTK